MNLINLVLLQSCTAGKFGGLLRKLPLVESFNGVLNYTLEISSSRYSVPELNVSFQTRSYNGMIPCATLRVKPGDKVILTLVNNLGENEDKTKIPANSSNLHIHGIYDSPRHDNTF